MKDGRNLNLDKMIRMCFIEEKESEGTYLIDDYAKVHLERSSFSKQMFLYDQNHIPEFKVLYKIF